MPDMLDEFRRNVNFENRFSKDKKIKFHVTSTRRILVVANRKTDMTEQIF